MSAGFSYSVTAAIADPVLNDAPWLWHFIASAYAALTARAERGGFGGWTYCFSVTPLGENQFRFRLEPIELRVQVR